MKFIDSLVIAIKSLYANKMRSGLTMLGIIIGVGSVIVLMSLGQGAQQSIATQIQEFGTNVVYIQATNPDTEGALALTPGLATPTLTLRDAEALAKLPLVKAVIPVNENFVSLQYGAESVTSVMEGSTPLYVETFGYKLDYGRNISDADIARRDMVVVLGSGIVKDLFGDKDPLGEQVKIKNKRFTVIGVLKERGGGMFGVSYDDIVITPITTMQARLFALVTATGENAVGSIAVSMVNEQAVPEGKQVLESELRRLHRLREGDKNDFNVMTPDELLGMFEIITGVLTVLLGAIGSISLLVGGIGIMNIMLVSVTERTREIGLRKAIGAKRRDILFQFLFEAAVLSLSGGGIGILGSVIVASIASRYMEASIGLSAVVTPGTVILAISVSVFIGLVSGIYPAMRAARLNPIDALRYG